MFSRPQNVDLEYIFGILFFDFNYSLYFILNLFTLVLLQMYKVDGAKEDSTAANIQE